jgi:hypothetical protein
VCTAQCCSYLRLSGGCFLWLLVLVLVLRAHHYSASREGCAIIKNFFSGWESGGLSSNSHPRREKATRQTIVVIPHSFIHSLFFIIHYSLLITHTSHRHNYWPTGAFLHQLPLPLPLPSHCCHYYLQATLPLAIVQEPRSLSLLQSGCRRLRLLILATLKTRPTGGFLHIHIPRPSFKRVTILGS